MQRVPAALLMGYVPGERAGHDLLVTSDWQQHLDELMCNHHMYGKDHGFNRSGSA
jgi:hypothetical protein